LSSTAAPASFWSSSLMANLDDSELAAIVSILPEGFTPPQRRPVSGVVRPPDVTELPLVTRMPRPIVPSLLPDLVRVLRCKPKPAEVAFFALTYRPSGQAREVMLQGEAGSEKCTDVAKILTALEVADGLDAVSDQRRDLVVIPMRATDLACLDRPVPKRRPTELGWRIVAPRKTKNVLPVYPPKLIQERVQGVVRVEALVTSTGCVAEATVTRAVHPLLDASAVVAVSQWEYTPTLLNGQPVPVIMTVTVNYSLRP
jgi:TonB family protein